MPVHHRETAGRDVNAGERPGLEPGATGSAFKEGHAQKHRDVGRKVESAIYESTREFERRVCNDAVNWRIHGEEEINTEC
jgi:hypothetical protein